MTCLSSSFSRRITSVISYNQSECAQEVQRLWKMVDELWATASCHWCRCRAWTGWGRRWGRGQRIVTTSWGPVQGGQGATGARSVNQDIYLRCSGTQTEPHGCKTQAASVSSVRQWKKIKKEKTPHLPSSPITHKTDTQQKTSWQRLKKMTKCKVVQKDQIKTWILVYVCVRVDVCVCVCVRVCVHLYLLSMVCGRTNVPWQCCRLAFSWYLHIDYSRRQVYLMIYFHKG